MAKRADAVPINRVPWVAMGRKLKQLAVLPKDNNCQNSTEKAAPVGMAIDKNQPAFLQWTRAVEKDLEGKLKALQGQIGDVLSKDLNTFNDRMKGTGLPGIAVPPARRPTSQ